MNDPMDQTPQPTAPLPTTPASDAPSAPRRRGRKPKTLPAKETTASAPVPEAPSTPHRRGRKPKNATTPPTETESPVEQHVRRSSSTSYPEPETVGGHEPQGNHRRRHRGRRRSGLEMAASSAHPVAVDPEELHRRAWKIFLGEVTEEGLALMDDSIAIETARRAFRVAEIFLIESASHR